MKIRTNRIYPYPVYSVFSDDYVNNNFIVDREVVYDSEIATIHLSVSIDNKAIKDMIIDGRVGLYCHVECSNTKYRELFEVDLFDGYESEIAIPLPKLNNVVEIICLLVAKEEISDFTDETLNGLFKEQKVHFPKYSTIGYTNTDEITLVKKMDTNGEVPSIFVVTADESSDELYYDADIEEQIIVYLPKKQYDVYETYKGTGVRIKQMMIIVPVLALLLERIKTNPSEYSEKGWYNALENALIGQGLSGFDDQKFLNKDSWAMAQKILGKVSEEGFKEFDLLNASQDKE